MRAGNVVQKLIEKIRQQWKTVRKAFRDFNEDNDPYIQKEELFFFLNHWGFPISKDQADEVFDYFDDDKDGLISYQDFIMSIGYEIHPEETLYFRQDVHHSIKQSVCAYKGCWQACKGRSAYCVAHLKLCMSKIDKLYQNIYEKIKKNYPNNGWGKFMVQLKRCATYGDGRLIKIDSLADILACFKLKLLDKQKDTILKLYKVKYGSEPGLINIQPILDLRKKQRQTSAYGKVDVKESQQVTQHDGFGFIGDFDRTRVKKKKVPATEEELIDMMFLTDRMKEIGLAIREIDPDRNGYITNQELDDIIRINYTKEMEGKHIFDFIKQFASSSNPILIDYNLFKKHMFTAVKQRKEQEESFYNIKIKDFQKVIQSKIRKPVNLNPRKNPLAESELEKFREFSPMGKFQNSIKSGRLTEDLLSEVRSLFDAHQDSPTIKGRKDDNRQIQKKDISVTIPY